MFVLIVVSEHRINPGHNWDFENKCGYSNQTRPFFSRPNEKEKKKRSGHARLARACTCMCVNLATSKLSLYFCRMPRSLWVIPVVFVVGTVGIAGLYITMKIRLYKAITVGVYRVVQYVYSIVNRILPISA